MSWFVVKLALEVFDIVNYLRLLSDLFVVFGLRVVDPFEIVVVLWNCALKVFLDVS